MSSNVWDPDLASELYGDSVALLGELGLLDADAGERFRAALFSAKIQGDEELHDLVTERLHRHARLLERMSVLTYLAADSVERHDLLLLRAVSEGMRVLAAQGFDSLQKDGVQDGR